MDLVIGYLSSNGRIIVNEMQNTRISKSSLTEPITKYVLAFGITP
jgi:hypothetical protein